MRERRAWQRGHFSSSSRDPRGGSCVRALRHSEAHLACCPREAQRRPDRSRDPSRQATDPHAPGLICPAHRRSPRRLRSQGQSDREDPPRHVVGSAPLQAQEVAPRRQQRRPHGGPSRTLRVRCGRARRPLRPREARAA